MYMVNNNIGSYAKTTKYSVFCYGCQNYDYEKGYSIGYMIVSEYCKKRNITRSQLRTLIKNQWVACTKGSKTRLSVKELCPDEIDDYLA